MMIGEFFSKICLSVELEISKTWLYVIKEANPYNLWPYFLYLFLYLLVIVMEVLLGADDEQVRPKKLIFMNNSQTNIWTTEFL